MIVPLNEQDGYDKQLQQEQQRDSVISSSTAASEDDDSVGEHLPPRAERDWNHVRHGSTTSAVLKMDDRDEKFLRDF